jgi:glycosyltransferase involved in cell wall biosynthesis
MQSDPIRIIILLMIKNESKIIKRSIDSTLSFADAICIEDTGSTDDTVEVIKEHYKTITIPTKITQHPWRNFGYSRSHSFIAAQEFCKEIGWNPARTYVLAMDADMNLIVSHTFNKDTLSLSGYQVMQIGGSLEYVNMRIMRISDSWSCIGATHEYWNMPTGQQSGEITKEFIYIDDKNDGGCKSDKFTRDLQLLLDELKEQPSNVRTHFYLAQTYKCLHDYDNAIKIYKKRIKLGGWFEEVWFSYYMVAQLYLVTNQSEKAELWAQRGQKYNNYRAESLYQLAKYFRIQPSSQWKAMHYLKEAMKISKPRVALFTEGDIYDYLIDYEYTILQYYVNPVRKEGNIASIKYMLKSNPPNIDSVFSNLEFYVEPFPRHYTTKHLSAPDFGDYKASSPSAINLPNGDVLMNIRYVNYETRRDGTYHPRDSEGHVRTRNAYLTYKYPLNEPITSHILTFIDDMIPSDLTVHPTRVHGFEDVRLIPFNDMIYYTASSSEFSPQFRVIFGEYDRATNKFTNNRVLQPPTQTTCEKNWLALTHLPHIHFIYNWHPLQIGQIPTAPSNTLDITIKHETPPYFKHLRGSANAILYKDCIYVLTHAVKYATPRKYMHHIIKLDRESMKPLAISHAFAFDEMLIEYCLTMNMRDDIVEFIYSNFDADPRMKQVPFSEFTFIPL